MQSRTDGPGWFPGLAGDPAAVPGMVVRMVRGLLDTFRATP